MMSNVPVWMIDAILVGVVIEFIVVRALLIRNGAAGFIGPLFLFLISGAFLLAAVRLSLSGVNGGAIALILFAAFISHGLMLFVSYDRLQPKR